jgi:deazaflavin-dependent oxidoreductase (nitroreductase family)
MTDRKTNASGFNARIIPEFRANEGRVGGSLAGTTLILIHHVGAKSGIERVTPVAASLREDGRCVIVASNGGSLTHPAWCHNLRANPRIEVELGTETFTVLAEELKGPARAGVWPKLVAEAPQVGEFQSRVARRIPVFRLTRT